MTNPAKAKGTRWESDVVRFLRERGHPDARRVVQEGALDTGDIHVGPAMLQAKAYRDILRGLSEGVAGYRAQRPRSGLPYGAAVVKRPRKSVGEGYAVMTLEDFASLLADLRASRPPGRG